MGVHSSVFALTKYLLPGEQWAFCLVCGTQVAAQHENSVVQPSAGNNMTDLGDFDEQIVHSGGTAAGLGTPSKAGSATRSGAACTVCGSRTFENTSFGTWVCIDCGTASQDVRLATQDIDEGRDLAAMRRTKRKRNDTDPVVTLPTAHSAQMNFIKAWMHIIQLQTHFITGHFSEAVSAAYTSTVRLLVRRYLRWWAAGDRPGVSASSPTAARHAYPLFLVVNGSLVLPPSTAYCSLLPHGVPPPWAPPVSMQLTLGIAAAAARLTGLPTTACHLLQAAVQGALPFMAAWAHVPAELRENMTFAVAFFTPATAPRPPTLDGVEQAAAALATCTGVPLPAPNTGAVLQSWLGCCGLLTPPLTARVTSLVGHLPEALPTLSAGGRSRTGMQPPGTGAALPFPSHAAAPEERTDSAVFAAAVFCLALLSHRDGSRIGALWGAATTAAAGETAAGLGASTSHVPSDYACAFRVPPLPLGAWAGVGSVASPLTSQARGDGGTLPPRHQRRTHGPDSVDVSQFDAWAHAAAVTLHGGAAVPGLAATGSAKARTSNAEKAAFTKWRLYAMEDRMFDAPEGDGDDEEEGGAGGGMRPAQPTAAAPTVPVQLAV